MKKPIYLMAGGREGRNTEIIMKKIFAELSKPPIIAYLGAASEDNRMFYERISHMITGAGKCKVVLAPTYAKNADMEKTKEVLNSADAIFVSGGDVEAGMKVLQDKGVTGLLHDLYINGKLFFGSSAGSIMMAREWVRWRDPDDDSTAELFPCLGLAPVLCDTHAEADDWEELRAALKLEKEGITGYGITTGACLTVFPDGRVEALGGAVSRYIHEGETVRKQADLVP